MRENKNNGHTPRARSEGVGGIWGDLGWFSRPKKKGLRLFCRACTPLRRRRLHGVVGQRAALRVMLRGCRCRSMILFIFRLSTRGFPANDRTELSGSILFVCHFLSSLDTYFRVRWRWLRARGRSASARRPRQRRPRQRVETTPSMNCRLL